MDKLRAALGEVFAIEAAIPHKQRMPAHLSHRPGDRLDLTLPDPLAQLQPAEIQLPGQLGGDRVF
jgi:hypothetical protein